MHVNPKPKPPLPGGEYTFTTDTGRQGVRPGIPVVNLIPVGDGGPGPLLPRPPKKRRPVLPTAAEVAALPRAARAAFAERCALRVEPLVRLDPTADAAGAAAVAILRRPGTVGAPVHPPRLRPRAAAGEDERLDRRHAGAGGGVRPAVAGGTSAEVGAGNERAASVTACGSTERAG